MSYLSLLTGIVVGICAYAGMHFLLIFYQTRKVYTSDTLYILFAGMCFCAVSVLISELIAYNVQHPQAFVEAFRWRGIMAFLFLAIWAWFTHIYSHSTHYRIPLLISVAFSIFILSSLLSPYGQSFDELPQLKVLVLPWGEEVTFTEFSMNATGKIIWLMVMALYLYTLYSCVKLYLQGRRRQAKIMALGVLVFIGFTVENYFVRTGQLNFIYTAAFGFPALLVIVGINLHQDAIERVERVYAITDFVPASVYVKDLDGKYLMVNRTFQEKHQKNNKEILGRTDYDLHSDSIADKYIENDRVVMDRKKPVEFNEQSKDLNGRDQYYQSVKYPLYDADNHIYAVCGISIDVTDKRNAQSLIGQTESRYRNLFENANDAIFILRDFAFIDMNQKAMEMFQVSINEINNVRLLDFLPQLQPSGRVSAQLTVEKIHLAMNDAPQLFEWKLLRADGSTFDAELNFSRIKLSDEVLVQAIVRDISERKQAERDLNRQRDLLETSVNATPGSYFMFNTKGSVIYSNRAFKHAIGLSPEDLKNINVIDYFVYVDDLSKAYRAIENAIRTNRTVWEQIRVRLKNDNIRTVLATVSPFRIDDEVYIVGAAVDITERVEIELELQGYRDHLEELVAARTEELELANRELETFSYSVSHDLRSPLRTINGFSRALLDEYGEQIGEGGKGYLSRVMSSSVLMGELIDDILNLSRINRSTLNIIDVDLSQMASEIFDQFDSDSRQHPVKIRITPDLLVTGDQRLLYIMMTNLLENAWKYTGNSVAPVIEFGQLEKEGEQVFYVRDNGAGFDMRYADKLFAAFQRLHGREFPGTGIGLATVSRVLNRHGGKIWAEASPGQGATFYFTLSTLVKGEVEGDITSIPIMSNAPRHSGISG